MKHVLMISLLFLAACAHEPGEHFNGTKTGGPSRSTSDPEYYHDSHTPGDGLRQPETIPTETKRPCLEDPQHFNCPPPNGAL